MYDLNRRTNKCDKKERNQRKQWSELIKQINIIGKKTNFILFKKFFIFFKQFRMFQNGQKCV